jgi:hypothetical protein
MTMAMETMAMETMAMVIAFLTVISFLTSYLR